MPIVKDIIYPVFLECCKYTQEKFWSDIFEDLAYGITPYGTYISKEFFCCSYKTKEFSYKIENKNPETLYKEIYNLLANKLGLLSHQEKIKKKIVFQNIENTISESRKCWANIKKKNIKEILIEQYVISMKQKYNLSIKQSRYLISLIFIAMIFKVINTKDIIYENGKIEKIEGIEFSNKNVVLDRNIYDSEIEFSPNIVLEKKIMSDNWEKYLKELMKTNIDD